MKKFFLIISFSILSIFGTAQNSFFIGGEAGGILQRYHYENDKNVTSTQTAVSTVLGGYFGYAFRSYAIEVGFYAVHLTIPLLDYNTLTHEVSKSSSEYHGRQGWLIPLRFSKTFLLAGDKVFIKPELGINMNISDFYHEDLSFTFLHRLNEDSDGGYHGLAYAYWQSQYLFIIEPGFSIGYRFSERADIYLRCSYMVDLGDSYYEEITHLIPYTVNATRTMKNTVQFKIGFAYHFLRR